MTHNIPFIERGKVSILILSKQQMVKYLVAFIFLLNIACNKSSNSPTACFKGKLVLKGICMNYVIQITEGNVDSSLYEISWQNPESGITYQNVFGLESI